MKKRKSLNTTRKRKGKRLYLNMALSQLTRQLLPKSSMLEKQLMENPFGEVGKKNITWILPYACRFMRIPCISTHVVTIAMAQWLVVFGMPCIQEFKRT